MPRPTKSSYSRLPQTGKLKARLKSKLPRPCPRLPTELLIQIFAHLQVADLFAVQHTCHGFYDIVSESAFLQYILHTKINHLEDLLPPGDDVSFQERVSLLKHHETAWNNLELNVFAVVNEEIHDNTYILQDGYLIYNKVTTMTAPRYGYVDLYSISDAPNAEARWTHILAAVHPLSDIVFAVDHNLVVAISTEQNGSHESAFLEFTTGARHPLTSVHTVSLPRNPEVEVFGDYLLVIAEGVFSVVSWKTGANTQLYKLFGVQRIVIIDPDDGLIALLQSASNNLHICKLQFVSAQPHGPRLHTVCSLRLPGFLYNNPTYKFMSRREWIPTSKLRDIAESQTSRRRPFPFRPYRASTIGIILRFGALFRRYFMFVCVDSLLSFLHSGARHVPWDNWGPASTRIIPLRQGLRVLPTLAGPFWITSGRDATLVVRDYNSLRSRYINMTKHGQSTSSTTFKPSLGPPLIDLFGQRGEIKTHLPYRTFADGPHFTQVVADREWVVAISPPSIEHGTSVTVYHVG